MTEKTFKLVTACIGGVETIAVAIITFCEPAHAAAINSAILIAGTAAIEICSLFKV